MMMANWLHAWSKGNVYDILITMKELYKMFGHKSLLKKKLNKSCWTFPTAGITTASCRLYDRFSWCVVRRKNWGFKGSHSRTEGDVDLDCHDAIDIVGTGGDGKIRSIFLRRLVLWWPSRLRVAKHGNYGASSVSGASNVLEQHGVKFTDTRSVSNRWKKAGSLICMHLFLALPWKV